MIVVGLAASVVGCMQANPNIVVGAPNVSQSTNIVVGGGNNPPAGPNAPIIASLDYLPKDVLSATDTVAFSLVATDPNFRPLQYNWTASKGQLLSTAGSTVNWRPLRSDGSVDEGTAIIAVVVSNGVSTTTGQVQIGIAVDKSAPASAAPGQGGTPTTAKTQTVIISRMTPAVALSPAPTAAP